MNYFELYELPVSFHVDAGYVKQKFYELSKKYHPDFHITESEKKQQEILNLSTLNNKAYQVLSDPLKRIEYVLHLNNLLTEGEKYQLPQHFLMEMMEVNEALMEQEFEPDAQAMDSIQNQVDTIERELFDELQILITAYDSDTTSDKKELLLKVKDIWYRQKYLMRIRESLNKFHL